MNLQKFLDNLTPLPLILAIEYGVLTTMNAYNDPLFRKGLQMRIDGEMSDWQFQKFCERHGFLLF